MCPKRCGRNCVRNVLLDAGAQIALFAVDDQYHARFDRLVTELSGTGLRLLTTWPCVVEACHLLDVPQRFELLFWIERRGALVYAFEPHHLGDMVGWMQRYTEPGKREMDLADASLYWLAAETGITEIMTVDIADFSRYRLPDGRAFVLL
jgi:predicted nucleic acid-binding protein